ncbi:MAG: Asp-tRNA(Asn)/Glu-tRNA(Gln) amidotransferase subunit GatA [Patescibacteria group bacterium]
MKLNELTIDQAHQGLVAKDFSAVELTQACLNCIEKTDSKINAFLSLDSKNALEQAVVVDQRISANKKIEILEGIPLAIKDNICIEKTKTTAGSKMLENYLAPYSATVFNKLHEQGVVVLGKTNMDEFAMGSSTETSAFGPTKNPHDLKCSPGGSSGGSAAAVASGMALGALGSDTGGSIRQPASFCGLVGFKPTYGRVSRYGLLAMASSLDQIGPLGKTVNDVRQIFKVIEGRDDKDATTINLDNFKTKTKKNLRIGLLKESLGQGLDPKIETEIRKIIQKLNGLGIEVEEVSVPEIDKSLACYYVIMPAEVSSNLSRYDGVRFGDQKIAAKNLEEYYIKTRSAGFGDEVKRRIMLGTFVLSAGYCDAYYRQAQKVRQVIKNNFDQVFQAFDFIISPTTPTPAFKLGEKVDDPLAMYLSDIYTAPANLAGLPAISLPIGKIGKLPIGLQIMGPQMSDYEVLNFAEIIEKI